MSQTKSISDIDGKASHTWEESNSQKFWEQAVQEDEQGRIVVAAGETLAQAIRNRRKRLALNDYNQRNKRIARDMIRYVYVIIDASRWMRQKDEILPPGQRIDATIQLLQEFVQEYYDQNPLSHLGFVVVKNGEAEILTQLSSGSKTHKVALQSVTQMAASEGPGGEFSLQNGLELAGRSLGHQPRHGSREIIVVTAALSTCDPGYILTETLPKLLASKIRVSCFALAAELYICRRLAEETHGSLGVCLDKAHFREWLHNQTVPPPAHDPNSNATLCEMVRMGFPTRVSSDIPELVHATREKIILARTAYICPQCQARNAELPTDCAVCGLKLVLAPHLARSFHHLFPVAPFIEIPVEKGESLTAVTPTPKVASSGHIALQESLDHSLLVTSKDNDRCCYACLRSLAELSTNSNTQVESHDLLRFQCPGCEQVFCVDCDAYLHEQLHNCPGCLSL